MRSRYPHILIPVDFRLNNQWAIDVALEMAKANSSRVTLLHVVESIDAVADDKDIQQFLSHCEERAESELERFSQPFEAIGVSVDYHVLNGHRVAQIVTYADEHSIDLIIMSSHPLDPENLPQSLVTLSYQVSLAARCSVLMVKSPKTEQ